MRSTGRPSALAVSIAELIAPLYIAGATLQEIADWLTRHRVLTPGGRIIWSRQAVDRVLRQAGLWRPRPRGPLGCRRMARGTRVTLAGSTPTGLRDRQNGYPA